jgi:hypothetical protein
LLLTSFSSQEDTPALPAAPRVCKDLCVRPAFAGAGWNGKEAAIFDVVQWETRGLEFAWALVLHPQDSILVEARVGVCSVVHTSVSLNGAAGTC